MLAGGSSTVIESPGGGPRGPGHRGAPFMYLILAAQFESWMQPIAILMALPVTIPFGMLSLILWHTPMDLYAMFGLSVLVGIVKKNGILQVDATNQLRAKGLSRFDAILEANHTRLRPILMTTVMLVAAMVPIAFGRGPGSGARASMAKVIIGGQMLSLLLAILVTPVCYALLDQVVNLAHRLGIRCTVEPRPRPHPAIEASDRRVIMNPVFLFPRGFGSPSLPVFSPDQRGPVECMSCRFRSS
jgi:hydrophobic/amphiphilic exporter-1 (mainly G- bacteria), HAE1 family